MFEKDELNQILKGFMLVQEETPILAEKLIPVLKKTPEICENLKKEYENYTSFSIVREGISCQFRELVKLGCNPGSVPNYECKPSLEVIGPTIEKIKEMLHLALLLGCKWAQKEADKLGINLEDLSR